jgi:hypothetical protein
LVVLKVAAAGIEGPGRWPRLSGGAGFFVDGEESLGKAPSTAGHG